MGTPATGIPAVPARIVAAVSQNKKEASRLRPLTLKAYSVVVEEW